MIPQEAVDIAPVVSTMIAAISATIAAIGLMFTASTNRRNARATYAQFWFEVDDKFSAYNDIHEKLLPGGKWHTTEDGGPQTREEWRRLEEYLRLFERGLMLYRAKLIDKEEFGCWCFCPPLKGGDLEYCAASGMVRQQASNLLRRVGASVRRELWTRTTFCESCGQTDTVKVLRAFVEPLIYAVCYAA